MIGPVFGWSRNWVIFWSLAFSRSQNVIGFTILRWDCSLKSGWWVYFDHVNGDVVLGPFIFEQKFVLSHVEIKSLVGCKAFPISTSLMIFSRCPFYPLKLSEFMTGLQLRLMAFPLKINFWNSNQNFRVENLGVLFLFQLLLLNRFNSSSRCFDLMKWHFSFGWGDSILIQSVFIIKSLGHLSGLA